MSSAGEAEAAGLFHNCQIACGIRTVLQEMGWPQPPTIVECDNTTAAGIANDTVKPKRTKAMDMRHNDEEDGFPAYNPDDFEERPPAVAPHDAIEVVPTAPIEPKD